MLNTGFIFDIQRFSVHDGPGLRSTIFMKGCLLHCLWCANPESQANHVEVMHRNSKCTKCGSCVEICQSHSIQLTDEGVQIDRNDCTLCGKCVDVCSSGALTSVGKYMSVEEVVEELKKDVLFYRNSNGGVTLGGGELLTQPDFVCSLLEACHNIGLHTAIDTCGYYNNQIITRVLKEVDLVLYDLKHMDPLKHREFTGVSNDLILENAKLISSLGVPMIMRVPYIPTINDSIENLRATANFIAELDGIGKVSLLPYHQGGMGKYRNLDRVYPLEGIELPKDEDLIVAKELMMSYGLEVEIGA